ncbi:MAG: HlyC/CorC family transporter [Lachnospiraceae bacterium]|nr:HlyC/CorC family transporter [Lachnospiraceae bacterium]
MDHPAVGIIILGIFIVINGILYGFSEAIRIVNQSELEKKEEEGSKAAGKVIKLAEKPEKLINTIHIVSSTMMLCVGFFHVLKYEPKLEAFLASKFALYFTDAAIVATSYILVAIYFLLLMIVLGIMLPKRIGRKYNVALSLGLVGIVRMLMIIFTPVTFVFTFFLNLILRIIGIDPKAIEDNVTEEEIVSIVNEGHEQGILMASEAEMINNIIELDEKDASDIMIHRKNIIAIDGDMTLKETVEFILEEKISRFPVYKDNIDNIIGIMHLRDAMQMFYGKENTEYADMKVCDIPEIIRKADFIPETRNVDILFKEMQSNKTHMVIVVDEYGQTAGLVAMEDILEEIVGNILDEYDEEENNIVTEGENVYIVKGATTLEELEDAFGLTFDEEDYDTINGYLISKLDRIPEEDDKPVIEIDGNTYEVLSIENKMISTIRMTLCIKDSEEDENE